MTAARTSLLTWLLAILAAAVFFFVLTMAFDANQMIAFGAPTRPIWSTVILVILAVIVPVGVGAALLLRTARRLINGRLAPAIWNIFAAFAAPILGSLLAVSLLSSGLIP